jgi:hypothetical protein
MMQYPRMIRIRQHFNAHSIEDVACAVRDELIKIDLPQRIQPDETVAITAGSRGIANIALITKTLVEELKRYGAKPFIVPAMGSHGGGTAEGQREIIEGYGVTEEYVGAPIKASMDVVQVGRTEDGIPVFFDKYAYEADHVVVVNRVKPHTDFVGDIESGLHKMMLIGLGKHRGASIYHKAIVHYSFGHIIRSVGQTVIDKCHILCGLGIVENQKHETALIEAIKPGDFLEKEKALLRQSKQWIPQLPVDYADLLIIDQIGKDISGAGMDSNVIGRKFYHHRAAEDEFPRITRIYVRDLTEATHGNAAGIGSAEYAHTQLINKMDVEATYTNCMTASSPAGASIPIHYDTDRKVLDRALQTIGYVNPEQAKVIRIHNTLDLEQMLISEAYYDEIQNRSDLTIFESAHNMEFTEEGNLFPF